MIGLAAAVAVLGGQASAQEFGDAGRGFDLAKRVCIACHGIRPGEFSAHAEAPTFTAIAAVRGMSPTALTVALLSPHRSMPNIMLDAGERADVVAYILSLKGR